MALAYWHSREAWQAFATASDRVLTDPEAWRVMEAVSEDLLTEFWEEVVDLLACDAVRSCKTRQPWVRVGRERAGVLRPLAPVASPPWSDDSGTGTVQERYRPLTP
ncbi:MAG TPA: hypothetical protein VI542_24740 [Candidatus Tectomicrobia bacterium]